VNVRKAIAAAIDMPALQENVIKEYGLPTNYSLVPESLFLFEKPQWEEYLANHPKYEYNLEQAKQYLAKSKYPNGFECTFDTSEFSTFNSMSLAFEQALKEIGITVKINKISQDELISEAFGSGIKDGVRPYDLLILEWFADFPDPAGVLTPELMKGLIGDGGSNIAAYTNDKVDDLLNQQSKSTDDAERTRLMIEACNIVDAEVPYYVFAYPNALFGYNKRITGGVTDATPMWWWKFPVSQIKLSN
jgi:peptide/nickel transport system substrate-binding protein